VDEGEFWSEWDGRGRDNAVAICTGWASSHDDALKSVRRLGIDAREIELIHGWVGTVEKDIILDACTADGACLDDEDVYVDADTLVKATFAVVLVE
jgi:hypothetical protein